MEGTEELGTSQSIGPRPAREQHGTAAPAAAVGTEEQGWGSDLLPGDFDDAVAELLKGGVVECVDAAVGPDETTQRSVAVGEEMGWRREDVGIQVGGGAGVSVATGVGQPFRGGPSLLPAALSMANLFREVDKVRETDFNQSAAAVTRRVIPELRVHLFPEERDQLELLVFIYIAGGRAAGRRLRAATESSREMAAERGGPAATSWLLRRLNQEANAPLSEHDVTAAAVEMEGGRLGDSTGVVFLSGEGDEPYNPDTDPLL